MQEAEYNELVDALFARIEDLIDNGEGDIYVDSEGSLLNLEFPDGSVVVISRQVPTREVWVAAKSGGFHLARDEESSIWCSGTGEALDVLLDRVCSEHLGQSSDLFESGLA